MQSTLRAQECSADDCVRPVKCRGLCESHYKRSRYQPVAHARVCRFCGAAFNAKNVTRSYCYDTACARSRRNEQAREQGWSRKYRERHGRTDRHYDLKCVFCSSAFQSTKRSARFCSLECSSRNKAGWSTSKEVELVPRLRAWRGHVIPSEGASFVAGACPECGAAFVSAYSRTIYCSKRCNGNAQWRRRYARRGDFSVPTRVRFEIYERDGWTCHLCKLPVEVEAVGVLAPSLDHIEPRSRGGSDDPANLATAHSICNSMRRDIPVCEVDAAAYADRVRAEAMSADLAAAWDRLQPVFAALNRQLSDVDPDQGVQHASDVR